jgi:uncharacterized Zn ribbon protein
MAICDNCGYEFDLNDEDQMICEYCDKDVEEDGDEDENVEFDDI